MSQKILLLGAGLSATHLIEYLAKESEQNNWEITITDRDENLAKSKVIGPNTKALVLDTTNYELLDNLISAHDLVISMLPAYMHLSVANSCLKNKKHLVTASYLSKEMESMNDEVKKADLIFLNEIGLDPGLDHLTAMKILNDLKSEGNTVIEFESYTGGLISPENDDNPWNYKFTWNPRNVVLAGQGGAAKYLKSKLYKYIPYHQLFKQTKQIEIKGLGKFEGYANRDSLKYKEIYGLENVETMVRGTLRRPGFCSAWDVFVQLGATDDSYIIENSENLSNRDFISLFLPHHPTHSLENQLKNYLKINDTQLWEKLEWLDLFKPITAGIKNATPAQLLQHILEQKLKIKPHEKDMVVMWHKFKYLANNETKELEASLVIKGENQLHTAMSKTVGLPLGIAVKLILQNKIKSRGTIIPIDSEFYKQILPELHQLGIKMHFTPMI